MSRQSYKKSHSSRKEWDRIFQQKTLMLKPPILCKKMQDKTSLDRDSHSLLGRICNPTAISMSICNAENGKRKRIINPYTKCCRITNTAERGKRIINPYTKCCRITNTAERDILASERSPSFT